MTTFTDAVHMHGPVTIGIGGIVLPSSAVTADAQVAAGANIGGAKTIARQRRVFAQESATTVIDESRVIHVAHAAGTLIAFEAGHVVAAIGGATTTIDLKKNGTTVLTAQIVLDSGDAARVVVAGTLSTTAFVAGDVFEVSFLGATGGGTKGKGAFASLLLDENPV